MINEAPGGPGPLSSKQKDREGAALAPQCRLVLVKEVWCLGRPGPRDRPSDESIAEGVRIRKSGRQWNRK